MHATLRTVEEISALLHADRGHLRPGREEAPSHEGASRMTGFQVTTALL